MPMEFKLNRTRYFSEQYIIPIDSFIVQNCEIYYTKYNIKEILLDLSNHAADVGNQNSS